MKKIIEHYKEQGRQEMLIKVVSKLEELYDQYYAEGDVTACDFTVDMVAYLQDDFEGISK